MDNEDPNDTRTMPGSNLVDEVLADASNDPRGPKSDRLHMFSREDLEEKYRLQGRHNDELRDEVRQLAAQNESLHAALMEAVAKAEAYEAGRDETEPAEGAGHTPGTLWAKLLSDTEDERLARLQAALNLGAEGARCFTQNHQGRIEAIEYDLADVQAKLGAAFGFDTPQSLHSLTVAVQALRNLMVAGIAERTTSVEYELTMPEWRQPEGLEAEKAKVVDSLKAAGIDLHSVCGFEWPGDEMHDHVCGVPNPLHAVNHSCEQCGEPLTHVEAEKIAEAGR